MAEPVKLLMIQRRVTVHPDIMGGHALNVCKISSKSTKTVLRNLIVKLK